MRIPRSVLVMRIACLVALAASAALTAEYFQPERRFCPLAKACERAAASPLGSVLGVPTSVIGLVGFAALLGATLFAPRRARRIARPAAGFAALVGFGLVVYQFVALESPCPLCLIADASALAVGAAAITWPKWGRKGNPRRTEPAAGRGTWALTGFAVPAVFLLWPAPAAPPAWQRLDTPYAGRGVEDPSAAPAERSVQIVEYLNPFCAHCRATQERLERVIASFPVPVRVKRVYVWSSREIPFWARGCACAREQSKEPFFFAELLRARRETEAEVRAAAKRAGLDVARWSVCIDEPDTRFPLDRMHQAVNEARIQGLPTFDIGRRRLNGEQSEEEFRDALQAALGE